MGTGLSYSHGDGAQLFPCRQGSVIPMGMGVQLFPWGRGSAGPRHPNRAVQMLPSCFGEGDPTFPVLLGRDQTAALRTERDGGSSLASAVPVDRGRMKRPRWGRAGQWGSGADRRARGRAGHATGRYVDLGRPSAVWEVLSRDFSRVLAPRYPRGVDVVWHLPGGRLKAPQKHG